MRVEILGSGGSFTIPRPGCNCRVCAQARSKGAPYERTGPSLFVHGPDVLVDTPEEIKHQLNSSTVKNIAACVYSHWHGDHVMGRRVWWSLNYDFSHVRPQHRQTTLYLPHHVAADFRRHLGTWQHLSMLQDQGMVKIMELAEGQSFALGGVEVTPFALAESFVYGFRFRSRSRKLLVVPDDAFGWQPTDSERGADLAVLPMGIADVHPLTGRRQISKNHPVLADEATFAQTLALVRELDAKKVVLTHIEEHDRLSFDDLKKIAAQLRRKGQVVEFAYDLMSIDV